MKQIKSQIVTLMVFLGIGSIGLCAEPFAKGPYLGQKPPGMTPEIFAPGIISTRFHEHSYAVFSPDGTEVYWSSFFIDSYKYDFPSGLLFMKLKKRWSQPEYALISTKKDSGAPCFSFDGKKLYFSNYLDSCFFYNFSICDKYGPGNNENQTWRCN